MSGHDDGYIADIALAADRISEIVAEGAEAFAESWVLRSAAERQLEIIGEASGRLSDELADRHPEIPLSRARGMRNVIAHQYRNVDHDLVWEAIANDVPDLAEALVPLLAEIDRPDHGIGL